MKSIETLVPDIYSVLEADEHKTSDDNVEWFTEALASLVKGRLEHKRQGGTLRLSNLGTKCDRKLWYEVNSPELGEKLSGKSILKFMYGDIIELLLLFLAKEAGHKVEDTQKTVNLDGVEGHIDAIIDGCLVDVKSASSMSYKKFERNGLLEDDPFGYLTQLSGYLDASQDNPNLVNKKEVFFLANDKQFGDICLDRYRRGEIDRPSVESISRQIQGAIPDRSFRPVSDGKSGNEKLPTYCSYCSYKFSCHKGLRTFLYSTGPRFLTKVERLPDVPEIFL